MSAVVAWPAQVLLLLAVLGVRPATRSASRIMLLLQAAALCLCLLARCAVDRASPLPLACLLAVLAEAVVLAACLRGRGPGRPPFGVSWPPMLLAVLAAWLAFRLLPPPAPGAAAAALGTVLCGMIGLPATVREQGPATALLTAGHGVLLFVGLVPGPGWPGLLMAVLPQGVALAMFCFRPASAVEDGIGAG